MTRPIAYSLLAIVLLPFASGCALDSFGVGNSVSGYVQDKQEHLALMAQEREEIAEIKREAHRMKMDAQREYHSLVAEERARREQLEQACRLNDIAKQRNERLTQLRECQGEVVPEIESKLGLRMRQRLRVGEPELDVAEMKTRLTTISDSHDHRMRIWDEQMKAWKLRQAQHYAQQQENFKAYQQRVAAGLEPAPSASYGCDSCCNDTCCKGFQFQEFGEPAPKRPQMAVLANEVPLKLRLTMATMFDESTLEDTRTRRVYIPNQNPCCCPPKCCNECGCNDGSCGCGLLKRRCGGCNGRGCSDCTGCTDCAVNQAPVQNNLIATSRDVPGTNFTAPTSVGDGYMSVSDLDNGNYSSQFTNPNAGVRANTPSYPATNYSTISGIGR